MEATAMEISPSMTCWDQHAGFSCTQHLALKKHFEVDRNPDEETLQDLADRLELKKKEIETWFIFRKNMMKLKLSYRANRKKRRDPMYKPPPRYIPCRYQSIRISLVFYQERTLYQPKWKAGWNPGPNREDSSPSDSPGLPEALEALKRLKISSGYQSRAGNSQDF